MIKYPALIDLKTQNIVLCSCLSIVFSSPTLAQKDIKILGKAKE